MFGDPTYADAVRDRLVHNAHRIGAVRLDFNATGLTCFILVDLNHRLDPMRASS